MLKSVIGEPTKPGSATLPFFGVDPAIVDAAGKEVGPNVGGKLIIRRPWPSMLRTIYGDKDRYKKQYWSEFPGKYLTGDGARRDKDGYFWIVGRIDDVLDRRQAVEERELGVKVQMNELSHLRFGDRCATRTAPSPTSSTARPASLAIRTDPVSTAVSSSWRIDLGVSDADHRRAADVAVHGDIAFPVCDALG